MNEKECHNCKNMEFDIAFAPNITADSMKN